VIFKQILKNETQKGMLMADSASNPKLVIEDIDPLQDTILAEINVHLGSGIVNKDTLKFTDNGSFQPGDKNKLERFIDKILGNIEDSVVSRANIGTILDSLNTLSSEREGFTLEFAGAGLTNFVKNVYDQSYFAKGAAWVNAGYAFPCGLDLSACGKYIYNAPRIDSSSDVEAGLSLGYHSSAFSIAAELLYLSSNDSLNTSQSRIATQFVSSYKWDGSLNYKVSDLLSISGTFGKDFKDTKTKSQAVIALLGFNYSLGQLSSMLTSGVK
jgi:hypothetical protein